METSTQSNGSRVLTLAPPAARRPELVAPISESTARLLGAVAVLGIGVIHILDAASTYDSTRWIFWAYMTLIAAAVPVALLLLHSRSPLIWAAAAGLAIGPLVGYLWSRSIGLPGDAPDIGNWLCTLGMAALFVESSLIGLSLTRLGMSRRSRGPSELHGHTSPSHVPSTNGRPSVRSCGISCEPRAARRSLPPWRW